MLILEGKHPINNTNHLVSNKLTLNIMNLQRFLNCFTSNFI